MIHSPADISRMIIDLQADLTCVWIDIQEGVVS